MAVMKVSVQEVVVMKVNWMVKLVVADQRLTHLKRR
jgi:hypothetical protein